MINNKNDEIRVHLENNMRVYYSTCVPKQPKHFEQLKAV